MQWQINLSVKADIIIPLTFNRPFIRPSSVFDVAFFVEMDAEMSLGPTTTSSASIALFRSRSDKLNLDPSVDPHRDSYEEPLSPSSSSWFSTIFSGRRKKQQSRMFYMDMEELVVGERRSCRVVNRGMLPVRSENTEDEGGDRATYGSSQEVSPRWRWRRTLVACDEGRRLVSRAETCPDWRSV
ncbi:hypothetical protein SLEP1_g2792 [Rubroshorea leprosula]|uniref:Uncharacterized protein n=1 Tax=Rubroshorea leprosula TaxID=152421 RepID=A0AAV5HU54_9ROSI|nr:hypothetical protein SLEP1_g2792 [Rubroshorea leprosula]